MAFDTVKYRDTVKNGLDRRTFIRQAAGAAALGLAATGMDFARPHVAWSQERGERPKRADGISVINPRGRVPLSFIIDDSTCLVNLNRFAMPQFAVATGNRKVYNDNWRKWPDEIPDDFVRKFGNWCGEHGVKGKYSIVPYPACVGRLDRELPGWTDAEVKSSIELVRTLMLPNWDIHPEMVTHTWAIDTKTGHPFPEKSMKFAENWDWSVGKSADELTDYFTYALKILKNVGLPCEGVTTPGGFGGRSLVSLSKATLASCRDVFKTEIPHYFRHLYDEGSESVAPRVEYADDLDSDDPKCVVSIIGCTGDWTGGWDCSDRGFVDKFITPDLKSGRMVDVIERGEPACIVCHWTGIYFNGEEVGFKVFQEAVRRLHARYDHLLWMKLSEIARYWAAKELTTLTKTPGESIEINAPFACPAFTVRFAAKRTGKEPQFVHGDETQELRYSGGLKKLEPGTCIREFDELVCCFDLPKGKSRLTW
jgi:hypothetical protein